MPNRSIPLALLLSILLCGTGLEAAPDPKKKPAKGKSKKTPYAVLYLNGEYEILPAKDLKAKAKELGKEHKAAVKAWKQAKKDAKKAKQKFSEKKPKKPKLKVLKTLPSEEAAKAFVEKLKKEAEKKKNRSKKKSK